MIERLYHDDQPAALPPHHVEAEEAVLGSILLDREVIGRVSVTLDARDFYRERNGHIYQAMLSLYERSEPVDYLTVVTELERGAMLDQAGGVAYIGNLLGVVPTPIHADHYAKLVADAAVMRRLISAGGKIATLGFANQVDPETAVEKAEALVHEVVTRKASGGAVWNNVGLSDWTDELGRLSQGEATASRNPTGFIDMDRLLNGGLARSDLVVLAARPGFGKTSLAQGMAVNAATRWRAGVVFFSLEMSRLQLYNRMVAAEANVDLSRLQRGDIGHVESVKVGRALNTLAPIDIAIDDTPALTVSAMRSRLRRLMAERTVDLVIVDHLQLVAGSDRYRGNRVQEMGEITSGLKGLAKEENIPVLALSQLSRGVEQRQSKVPMLSDLRDSGTVEQDADVVMFIYRADKYDKEDSQQGLATLHVAKHRNGPTGEFSLLFHERSTRFVSVEVQERYWNT